MQRTFKTRRCDSDYDNKIQNQQIVPNDRQVVDIYAKRMEIKAAKKLLKNS